MSSLGLWIGMDIASIALVLAFTTRLITKKFAWVSALIGGISIIFITLGFIIDTMNDVPIVQDKLTKAQISHLTKVETTKNVFIGVLSFYIVWSFGSQYLTVSAKD